MAAYPAFVYVVSRAGRQVEKKLKIKDIQLVHLLVVWYLVNLQDARCKNKDFFCSRSDMWIQIWGWTVQIYKVRRFIYRIKCADKYNGDWNWESISQKQAFPVSIQRLQGKWRFPPAGIFPRLTSIIKVQESWPATQSNGKVRGRKRKAGNIVLRLFHEVNAGPSGGAV